MAIDRTNYELWFTDWSDNILNPEQIRELALFLRENPDLEAEFKALGYPLSLQPPVSKFIHKNDLFKTAGDIAEEKFDLLCAAYVENDLDPAGKAEVGELILKNPGLGKSLEQMKMTRLSPPPISFGKKEELFHSTRISNSLIPLSILGIAASVVVLLMLYFLRPSEKLVLTDRSAALVAPDTLLIVHNNPVIARESSSSSRPENKLVVKNEVPLADITVAEMITREDPSTFVNRIEISSGISSSMLVAETYRSVLAGFNPVYAQSGITDADDDRSRIGKFIARNFREKVLRSDNAADTPIKGYELAEAGVSGINKLFGWDMQLITNNNSQGRPTSVNFRSRLLKFNAPVNKNEQAE